MTQGKVIKSQPGSKLHPKRVEKEAKRIQTVLRFKPAPVDGSISCQGFKAHPIFDQKYNLLALFLLILNYYYYYNIYNS